MHEVWESCLDRLPELKNLHSIALIFDRHGSGDEFYISDDDDLLQSRYSRQSWRDKLFKLPGLELQELAIRHNQDFYSREDTHMTASLSELLKQDALRDQILNKLQSLRLSLVHEQIRGESGDILEVFFPAEMRTEAHHLADRRLSQGLCPASCHVAATGHTASQASHAVF